MHNSRQMYKSMPDCARYIYKREGVKAFFISYPTTLSMTIPYTSLQFLAYETLSTTMNPAKKYDPLSHCTAGALAGGFAAALTTPMDVMKTMLQTRGTATDSELRNVSGFKDSARILYQREGFRGFFKGVRPRVVTAMPSTAICWSAYEACKYVYHIHFFCVTETNAGTGHTSYLKMIRLFRTLEHNCGSDDNSLTRKVKCIDC
jgi:solute carrier family 25 iron transporter 28/37